MGKWLLFCALIFIQLPFAYANNDSNNNSNNSNNENREDTFDVAVLATRGDLNAQIRWQPTLDWLETQIHNVHFTLHTFSINEMSDAVKNKKIDFIITNPGQSVSLGRQYDLSWMATLEGSQGSDAAHMIGSTVLVKSTSNYYSITDLQGKNIAAVDKNAFGGYQTFAHEVQQNGFDLSRYFSNISFIGFPIDAIVYRLRDNAIDAIIVPTCLVEKMDKEGLIAKKDFRVINQKKHPNFHCAVSTQLYPNWSFAKTTGNHRALAKKITRALLAMPKDHPAAIASNSSGWTPLVSQLSIEKLHQDLDIAQLKIRWGVLTMRWISNHQQWIWALFIFVLFLIFYHFLLEYRFSKSKRQLAETLNQLKEKNSMLEHAQRVAIVGELGSSLAHEINQPLAAIRNYSQGGLIRLKNGNSNEEIINVFEIIQHQVSRADRIISRLRGLINKRETTKAYCDMEMIITDTLTLLDYALKKKNIVINRATSLNTQAIFVDSVGIQQVILNLISNASDACFEKSLGEHSCNINIETDYQEDQFYLHISDDGIGLKESSEKLQSAFFTTKAEGLGLGLAICRNVIELHHGQLTLENNKEAGCIATISIPIGNSKDNNKESKNE